MFSKNQKFKLTITALIAILLLTSGFGCKQGNLAAVNDLKKPITLKYWRVFDSSDSFSEIIGDYKYLHPNVNIEYRKLRYDEYEKALIEAWAEDRGPDIFAIHNTWVGEYESKILPMPETIKLPYVVSRNKKTEAIEEADYKQVKALNPIDIRNNFAETVYQDVVRNAKIFGLPLSVDTLALFYNRTMFDNGQIAKIPNTWVEVKEAVRRLTLQNDQGEIVQSGIALGTNNNINRYSDVLSLLMMQNGTEMVDESGRMAIFDQPSSFSTDKNYRPGQEATRFYTDFAMPAKEVYSWNEDMPEASQAFISERLAMMLGYSYQLPLIKTQGVRLNIGVAEVPHINSDGTDALGSKVNFASYWVETVAKKTENADYAWDFLMFAVSENEAIKYLKKTKKPTALRALIEGQMQDADIKPFANQVLTAKTWYHGNDADAAENAFGEMIGTVLKGKNTIEEAIHYAVQKVNLTF
ncbi:MAG: hypothetical protein ABIJ91_02835 [Candidatus Kuenenbacteria bacterium]